jgi:hypothetical protein
LVLVESGDDGVKIAVRPVQFIEPATGTPPSVSVKLNDVTVEHLTSWSKNAVTVALRATLDPPSAGRVDKTWGPLEPDEPPLSDNMTCCAGLPKEVSESPHARASIEMIDIKNS